MLFIAFVYGFSGEGFPDEPIAWESSKSAVQVYNSLISHLTVLRSLRDKSMDDLNTPRSRKVFQERSIAFKADLELLGQELLEANQVSKISISQNGDERYTRYFEAQLKNLTNAFFRALREFEAIETFVTVNQYTWFERLFGRSVRFYF